MPQYHISYDYDENLSDDAFSSYEEARRYLLCLLNRIPQIGYMYEFCESTIIFKIDNHNHQRLFTYLRRNMKPYFYYFISQIASDENRRPIYSANRNKELNNNFQEELEDLDCTDLEKPIRFTY